MILLFVLLGECSVLFFYLYPLVSYLACFGLSVLFLCFFFLCVFLVYVPYCFSSFLFYMLGDFVHILLFFMFLERLLAYGLRFFVVLVSSAVLVSLDVFVAYFILTRSIL